MLYKGQMVSDVPNLFFCSGYFHAAYTKRVDLTSIWACRVMRHMDEQGLDRCIVPRDPSIEDMERDLFPSTGYIQRALDTGTFPKTPALNTSWQTIPDPWIESR